MERYVCIHGHFYQPPRENPWLETVELQDSAHPYHDWNERVTAECYAPNSASRILDGEGCITTIVNNYASISFNFGPTLLAWLQENTPEPYQAILSADRESQERYSGHGSALAQAYNHILLPLANRRDKHTQVLWGVRDFEHRFGRRPEGMWLPETGVDLETLDILARLGLRFTILAPHQAHRVRPIGARGWRDVSGGRVDPSMAYKVRLGPRRDISVFFYDGPISRAIAFEGLLLKGESFAERLASAFNPARKWPQLVHVATDGETYGHHRRHGDMALAYALHYMESHQLARLTNYAEYLERCPPTHEARIFENSSWSCAHGVERWRSNCGCNSGLHAGWSQEWRAPLREAFDWLRDNLALGYEEQGRRLLKDPWAARDDYIEVVLDRSPESLGRFLARHATRELGEAERVAVLKLLEMQRHAMLMYTSCGWFFDDLSGIETVQVIQYAARALQLAEQLFGDSLQPEFLQRLSAARSNLPEHGDGRRIYEKFVNPAIVDLQKVGAHYAVSSLFESYPEHARMFCYGVERQDHRVFSSGKIRLVLGRARILSEVTQESATTSFGVLHLGDHNVFGGIREFRGDEAYAGLVQEIAEVFGRSELADLIRAVDKSFGIGTYSLKALFRDAQRKVVRRILESQLGEAEGMYRQLYNSQAPLMRFLAELGMPLPARFRMAAEVILNLDLGRALEAEEADSDGLRALLDEASRIAITLDRVNLEFALRRALERWTDKLVREPADLGLLQKVARMAELAPAVPFEVNLWRPQNSYYAILRSVYPGFREQADKGDTAAQNWLARFRRVGELLKVRVPS